MTRSIVAGVGIAVLAAIVWSAWPKPHTPPVQTPAVFAVPQGMVLVPGGAYRLFGGTCANCIATQTVKLDSFFIDRTEVTVEAYRARDSATRAQAAAGVGASAKLPATGVMWTEADSFCRARDPLTRLPTEQEWEAAARGTDAREYAWGNQWDAASANADGARAQVIAVGTFPRGASAAGALDMIGNVWEWTSTAGPLTADGRRQYIIRGGAYDTPRANATTYFRPSLPEASAANVRAEYYGKTGFRCARGLR